MQSSNRKRHLGYILDALARLSNSTATKSHNTLGVGKASKSGAFFLFKVYLIQ